MTETDRRQQVQATAAGASAAVPPARARKPRHLMFNARSIGRIRPESHPVDWFDKTTPGLSLRVAPGGARTWYAFYKKGKTTRRVKLGAWPGLELAEARKKARDARQSAEDGNDPARERHETREAPTFADLAADYLKKHAIPKKKSWKDDRRRIDNLLLPAWKHIPIKELKRRDVRMLIEAHAEGAPIAANRILALVRKMLNFAIKQDLVEANVTQAMDRPGAEKRRDRVLTDDEIRRLWAASDAEDPIIRDIFRLRLLTAQRQGEVVSMRWAEVDVEHAWWTIPAERSKNRHAHRVPLCGRALAIVKDRHSSRKEDAAWVFPSTHRAAPAIEMIRGAITRIATAAGVPNFDGKDLRRTAATRMASAGTPRVVVGKVLNHAEPHVTAVYDRATYDPEKKAALSGWALSLDAILTAKDNPEAR